MKTPIFLLHRKDVRLRDEWLLLRDAKAQNLKLITKPSAGIKYKGIVIPGVNNSIALSFGLIPLNKTDSYAYSKPW
ncbi:hypothetical protein BH18THE1_BH18THE1_15750 [soil metagenome]